MAGFLLAPCGNVHLVEMYRQGKQDADMRVRKNTVGHVWRGPKPSLICGAADGIIKVSAAPFLF